MKRRYIALLLFGTLFLVNVLGYILEYVIQTDQRQWFTFDHYWETITFSSAVTALFSFFEAAVIKKKRGWLIVPTIVLFLQILLIVEDDPNMRFGGEVAYINLVSLAKVLDIPSFFSGPSHQELPQIWLQLVHLDLTVVLWLYLSIACYCVKKMSNCFTSITKNSEPS